MPSYMVTLRLRADDHDALLQRLAELELAEEEGVLGIATEPEHVHVPPELQAPTAPLLPPEPAPPPEMPPPPEQVQPLEP